jgi:hypothetical protein
MATLGLVAAIIADACGAATSPSPNTTASQSAPASAFGSPSPATSPHVASGPFAVIATVADPYTVSLVAVDGKVVASAQASEPAWAAGCGPSGTGAHVPLPVSVSDTRAYFMDQKGVIGYLAPNGETHRVTTVAIGGSRYSMFSVSPDDQRIAVIVSDYTTGTVSQRLYIEDLIGGTNHLEIFSNTGAFGLWPVGWHGQSLVVAKVTACTSGGGPFCCGMLELHVVDPATAARQFTLGGPQCVIVGPPSPVGAICEDTTYARATALNWIGAPMRSFPIQGPTPALLAPDGSRAALNVDAHTTTFDPATRPLNLYACGWIDSNHVISGGSSPNPPLVADIVTGKIISVAAEGQCAGRMPGGL